MCSDWAAERDGACLRWRHAGDCVSLSLWSAQLQQVVGAGWGPFLAQPSIQSVN